MEEMAEAGGFRAGGGDDPSFPRRDSRKDSLT